MSAADELSTALQAATVTPARVFTGRSGTAYRTSTALRLRADHAAARDAVNTELDVSGPAVARLTGGRGATVVTTMASSRPEFVKRPDLGRRLGQQALEVLDGCARGADVQLVLGDGLSAKALAEQAPGLIAALTSGAAERGWRMGDLIVVANCRVGVLNDVGLALGATVVILLIGERPGLATASSLSAYLAHRPGPGDDDSNRNLVSNIHARGLPTAVAADRILRLADAMRERQTSGVAIKEAEALPAVLSRREELPTTLGT